jgi:hypothetical protein
MKGHTVVITSCPCDGTGARTAADAQWYADALVQRGWEGL